VDQPTNNLYGLKNICIAIDKKAWLTLHQIGIFTLLRISRKNNDLY